MVALILVVISSLSFVGAVDVNLTENAVTDHVDDNILVADSGTKSYQDLQLLINSSDNQVMLEDNYMFDVQKDSESYYKNGVSISNKHDFVVDGQGHFISGNLNGAAEYSKYGAKLLSVASSCNNVTLQNIVFKDVRYNDSQALTFSCSHITLKNCTFENIMVDDYAVLFNGAATLDNCTFVNDASFSKDLVYFSGEGILENSIFINNKANLGALNVQNEFNVTNCVFTNNTNRAIYSNGIINVKKSNFTNNGFDVDGGAIYSLGSIFISNSIFNNNTGERAGAIYSDSNITILNSYFSCNTGNFDAIIYFNGGIVDNCTFSNNRAWGTLYSPGGVNLTNTLFTGNEGRVLDLNGFTLVENCNFTNNDANTEGAIIYSANLTVLNSVFSNNRVNYGAIFEHVGSNVSIKFSKFLDNNCKFVIDSGFSNDEIKECVFLDNSGGNVWLQYSSADIGNNWYGNNADNYNVDMSKINGGTVDQWYFLDADIGYNFANISLNNVYNSSSNEKFKINDSKIPDLDFTLAGVNLTAPSNVILKNGVVSFFLLTHNNPMSLIISLQKYSYVKNVSIEGEFAILQKLIGDAGPNSIIELNKDYTYSIGFDNGTKGVSIYHDNVIINGNGHVINAQDMSAIFEINGNNVTLNNISFINSKNAIKWIGDHGYINNSSFVNSSSPSLGGTIYWIGDYGHINNSSFVNGSSLTVFQGGMIFWAGDYGSISNSSFVNGSSSREGGIIYWAGDYGSIDNSSFINGSATFEGGIVYWRGENGRISNSSLINASSPYAGGMIFWAGDYGSIDNSSFMNGSSLLSGGGFISWNGRYGNITNSNFVNGYSTDYGGAISINKPYSKVIDCNFINNSADKSGGAIYLTGDDSNIHGSVFVKNKAIDGGAVYINSNKGNFAYCNFTDNSAGNNGGAINLLNGIFNVMGCEFSKNSAFNGGAIFWMAPDGVVSSSHFANNSAKYGGAVNWNMANGKIIASEFAENVASRAGAVYWWGLKGTVESSNFTKNSATEEYGGAIYWYGEHGTVKSSNFENNFASTYGGAIYWTGYYGLVNDCNLINNSAATEGGAIYVKSHDVVVNNSTFKANQANRYRHISMQGIGLILENSALETTVLLNEIEDHLVGTNITINLTFDDGSNYGEYRVVLYNWDEDFIQFDVSPDYTYQFSSDNLTMGDYLISVGAIDENGNVFLTDYNPIKFKMYKYNSTVILYPIDSVFYKENVTVNFEIENKTFALYDVKDSKGHIVRMGIAQPNIIIIDDLYPGSYTLTISNQENATHLASSASAIFTVFEPKANTTIDVNVSLDCHNVSINVGVDAAATGYVLIGILGQNFFVPVEDGNAVFSFDFLAGTYNAVVTYLGDDNFNNVSTNVSFTVLCLTCVPTERLGSTFNVSGNMEIKTYAVDFNAGEHGQSFKFQLTDFNGQPIVGADVVFAYKTVIFNKTTDENGFVSLGVSSQLAGSYLCALSYLGDDKHNAAFVAFNFKLNKKPITIVASSKKFKLSTKTKKYTITLKTKKCASKNGKVYLKAGKKVTLKINGKKFTAKINKKGKATFKITNLKKKGKFSCIIKFAGDKTYKATSKKVKITVK